MRNAIYLVVCLILISCNGPHTRSTVSGVMTEPATVVDLVYTPSSHGDGISPSITMDGKLGIQFTSIDVKSKYAVIFECQHGKFIVENNQDKAKELWGRLHKGQSVTVTYREEYEEQYGEDNHIKGRTLQKYDFLDAR